MMVSGFSTWRRVLPSCPSCPPDGLFVFSRRFVERGFFRYPSLDGGLPLFELSSPNCRSNSLMRASCSTSRAHNASSSASFSSLVRVLRSGHWLIPTLESHFPQLGNPSNFLGCWAVTKRIKRERAKRRKGERVKREEEFYQDSSYPFTHLPHPPYPPFSLLCVSPS